MKKVLFSRIKFTNLNNFTASIGVDSGLGQRLIFEQKSSFFYLVQTQLKTLFRVVQSLRLIIISRKNEN